MARRKMSIITAMLLLAQLLAFAGGSVSFEGGQNEAVASLSGPVFEATINIEVPAGYYVTNATMKVSGMASENNAFAYPEGVTIKLNESTIWAFQQTGFGPLGMQNQFSTGQKMVNSSFGSAGGVKTQYIRLPKEANVQSAMMDVKGFPPAQGQELVNFSGRATGDRYGWYVSNAGDVNGDGFDDVIIGAPHVNESGGYYSGEAYLYFGGPDIDNSADVVFTGGGSLDIGIGQVAGVGDVNNDGYGDVGVCARAIGYIFFGGQQMDAIVDSNITRGLISSAGDVNNDGYDDVLISSPGANKACIYFGGEKINNTVDLFLNGDEFGSNFGFSSSGAGDVNGDGYDDVIVSDWVNWAGGSDAGRAWLFFGGKNMDNKSDIIMTGGLYERVGYDVSGAGDVNNDGYDDFIVGTAKKQAYLYLGGQNADNIPDITYTGEQTGFGEKVSLAGDMNNDGFDDILIGATYNVDVTKGQAFVFFGENLLDNVSDMNFSGVQDHYDHFGIALSGGGDVNGDDYDDVIIGATGNSDYNDPGHAYVYTCHGSNLTGISSPGVSIGTKNIWKGTGYFNGTATISDFAGEINTYLGSASISGKDAYGNAYINVPVNVNASGGGKLALFNLSIVYSYNASVPNFGALLNNFLVSHQNEKDANGVIKVPIKIRSQSAGRIKLSGLDFAPDKPPAHVKEIGTTELFEDSWNSSLIDLYPCFQDDIDPDTLLNFSVVSSTNSSYARLWISGKRYVSADAMTGDLNDNWTGTVEAVVACTDHWCQKTESNRFMILVKNVNDEPIITSVPSTIAEAGVPYYYNVTTIDGDNDTLQFSLPKAPANMTIDDITGRIHWLPRTKGDFMVSLLISDGIASAMQNFTISVPNKAPRITSLPPLNATTGVQYIYNITAEDDNLDALAFSLSSQIEGMTVDSLNGTIAWTPQYPGTVNVTAWVSDGKAKADQKFTISVLQGNRAPRFTNKASNSATVGLAYSYSPKATDEDGDVLSFSLVEAPDGMVINDATGRVDWTPAVSSNFTVKIKADDRRGGEVVQTFIINVADRVKAKVAIDRPSENEKVKGKVSVSGTAVKGTLDVMSVQIRIDSGEWTNVTGNYTWEFGIDTAKLKNGKHTIEGRAFDGKDFSDVAAVNFTVYNQKAAGKGFIPGFTGIMVVLALVAWSFAFLRKRNSKKDGAR
jgi:hypothetical protein